MTNANPTPCTCRKSECPECTARRRKVTAEVFGKLARAHERFGQKDLAESARAAAAKAAGR